MAKQTTKERLLVKSSMRLVAKPRNTSITTNILGFFSMLIMGLLINMTFAIFLVLNPKRICNGILSMLLTLILFVTLRPLQFLKNSMPSGSTVATYLMFKVSTNMASVLRIILDNVIPVLLLFTSTFMCHDYLSACTSLIIQGMIPQSVIDFIAEYLDIYVLEKIFVSIGIGLVCTRQRLRDHQDIVVVVSGILFILTFVIVQMFHSKSYTRIIENMPMAESMSTSLFSVYAILGTCSVLYYASIKLVDYDPAGQFFKYLRDKISSLAPVVDHIYPRPVAAGVQQPVANPPVANQPVVNPPAPLVLPSARIRLIIRCLRYLILLVNYGIPLFLTGIVSYFILLPNIIDMFFVFSILLTKSKYPHLPAIEIPTAVGTFNIQLIFKPILLIMIQSVSIKLYNVLYNKKIEEYNIETNKKKKLIEDKRKNAKKDLNAPITSQEIQEVSTIVDEIWGTFVLGFIHPNYVIPVLLLILSVLNFNSVFLSINIMVFSFGLCCIVAPLLYLVGILLRYSLKEKSLIKQAIIIAITVGVTVGILYHTYLFYLYYEQFSSGQTM
ncbi:uncharacterized protein VICG_00646 [Vittaforma corneae ATCC 50505]|uniref:Uncharacterized protein n=1 Tax=Vittaforma corneae (strain ATCC 50505) TaxID=993615 RepID=L2GPL2_VITCO|nr:uncharacterized protein VICG_00646 [Vittaforma corneae ATCC 50505]ELA42247.1 hypothetical protein VICG_00646 [Vittaforma corneae ATCC 50505]